MKLRINNSNGINDISDTNENKARSDNSRNNEINDTNLLYPVSSIVVISEKVVTQRRSTG